MSAADRKCKSNNTGWGGREKEEILSFVFSKPGETVKKMRTWLTSTSESSHCSSPQLLFILHLCLHFKTKQSGTFKEILRKLNSQHPLKFKCALSTRFFFFWASLGNSSQNQVKKRVNQRGKGGSFLVANCWLLKSFVASQISFLILFLLNQWIRWKDMGRNAVSLERPCLFCVIFVFL